MVIVSRVGYSKQIPEKHMQGLLDVYAGID